MGRAIDSEVAFCFLTEQKVKETGVFSKGVNKGLNIARSAMRNPDAIPTLPQPSNEPLTGWVSVNKRLPEKRKEVLVHYGNGRIGIDWIDSTQCFVFDELYGRVTHWLPIPELPDRRPQEGEADGK